LRAIRSILRVPNSQNSGIPMSGMSRMVKSQVTLLAGDRRCRTIVAATNSVNGVIRMPTRNIVPRIAKKKCQKELGIGLSPNSWS